MSREVYQCDARCFDRGVSMNGERAELRCGLPGFNRRSWQPPGRNGTFMGRLPVYDNSEVNPQEPPDRHDEGCPGSWYRSRFARSLVPYERSGRDGMFNENLRLTRCTDPLVLDAVQYLEHERLRAMSWNADRMNR